MNLNELAREQTAQQRQHNEERDDAVLGRATEDLEADDVESEAIREQVTDHRLHDEQLHNNVLSRAEEQLGQK